MLKADGRHQGETVCSYWFPPVQLHASCLTFELTGRRRKDDGLGLAKLCCHMECCAVEKLDDTKLALVHLKQCQKLFKLAI